jgi:DNA invertase Pin-like site-specific DNA recombinase
MNEIAVPLKIQPQHLDRMAVVYIRQSHPQQQSKHPESVATQLRLRERIQHWGWPEDRIRVLDGDLGKSGTTTVGREDYAWLVSEVTLNHIGLVAGFQINRLAREDETICHLIRICALFDTLIADQDGVYHPEDFNDRLVLTIKGLVGGIELHQIQQRMQHGRLERARRGEWLGATPMGYLLGADRKLVFDPDEQVQHAVRQVFKQFEHLGSVSALLRHFRNEGRRLPIREQTGASKGKISWRQPYRGTLRNILRNPAYAGAYTWGRHPVDPKRALAGRRGTGRVELAPEACDVFLRDNHPAYIDWKCFEKNIQRMSSHRRHGPEPSSQRQIVSLLAGRVFCGRCGQRMQTHYAPRLRYECARGAMDYGLPVCGSLPGNPIEQLVSEQILVAIEPASLELSVRAAEKIESERSELERHWQLRLERARQDAGRAFRQYDAAEPENRLVARTLERNWEATLVAVRTLTEEYDRVRALQSATLTEAERQSILDLSTNLPKLWNAPSIAIAEKRRVVQLLLEKIVVKGFHSEQMSIELHWVGGTVTHHEATRPVQCWSDLSTYPAILAHIQEMALRGSNSNEIASSLNEAGYRNCRQNMFTSRNVRQIRSRVPKSKINT